LNTNTGWGPNNARPYQGVPLVRLRGWLDDLDSNRREVAAIIVPVAYGWAAEQGQTFQGLIEPHAAAAAMCVLCKVVSAGLAGPALDQLLDLCRRRQDLRQFAGVLLQPREGGP